MDLIEEMELSGLRGLVEQVFQLEKNGDLLEPNNNQD